MNDELHTNSKQKTKEETNNNNKKASTERRPPLKSTNKTNICNHTSSATQYGTECGRLEKHADNMIRLITKHKINTHPRMQKTRISEINNKQNKIQNKQNKQHYISKNRKPNTSNQQLINHENTNTIHK